MSTLPRLLAALLCGLLVTGCTGTRDDAVTVHVHLDASLVAALPGPAEADDRPLEVGVVVGLRDPEAGIAPPRLPAAGAHCGGSSPAACGRSTSLGSLGGFDLGGGRGAGIVLVAVVAVVAVVLVTVVAWKVGAAIAAPHTASPPAIFALALGGGPEPAQLLRIRDGHAIHLDPALASALAHQSYSRATLQRSGSAVALPVLALLDGPMLCVRPAGAMPSR